MSADAELARLAGSPVPDEKSGRPAPGIRPRGLRGLRTLRGLRGLRGEAPLTSRCSPARHTTCTCIRQTGI